MAKSSDYLVGLDLGSHRIRCLVALEEDSHLRFISHGSAPSRGWARGVIADQDPVMASVEAAIEEAERNGGMVIEAAVVGVGGGHIRSNVCHSYVNLSAPGAEIGPEHIEDLVKTASHAPLSSDRTAIQVVPLEFTVDQQITVRNPRGMKARRLDGHAQVVSAAAQAHNNVHAVVNRAGIVVEETVFEAFAAAQAVLEEQERELGIAVADMGSGSTDLVAYVENDLRLALGIPLGGDHFVNDVAEVMKTSRSDAEMLIQQYGCATVDEAPSNVSVEVPRLSDGQPQTYPRSLLNEILRARAEEVFEVLAKELRRARIHDRLIGGLVLTGGLAALAGACDVAEDMLDCNVRIGLPPRIEDLPDQLDQPGWSTAMGLVLYGQRLRLHRKRRREKAREWLKAIFE
jgi:cell division protein FtsA